MPGRQAYEVELITPPGMDWATLIHIRGRITNAEAIDVQKNIHRQIDKRASSHVVLELGDVDAMDTAGASVLIEIIHDGLKKGRRTILCSPSESVVSMFELAGLRNVLDYSCNSQQETLDVLMADAPAPRTEIARS